ncbi:MAG: hypothetical protein Q9M33_09975 [Robiginitomaculum sp.]|nr:hypothetical protein [Robiginitomaculum sp.]MDQ7077215.1 hypothetical protein [Robiginitomaculum sp.]
MPPHKRRFLLNIFGLFIAFLGLEWSARVLFPGGNLPYAIAVFRYLLPTLPLLAIIPLASRYFRQSPEPSLSQRRIAPVRRYMTRLGTSMLLYAIFLVSSIVALDQFTLSLQIKTFLAVLTALPIGGVIWAVARFMADPDVDEFERTILTHSVLLSTALILFFTALWGFLENFAKAPDFPLYLIVPVFFGLFGLVQPFVRRGFR